MNSAADRTRYPVTRDKKDKSPWFRMETNLRGYNRPPDEIIPVYQHNTPAAAPGLFRVAAGFVSILRENSQTLY